MREAHGQVLAPLRDPSHPEVRLVEVDLALAGEPRQLEVAQRVALRGHLLPQAPHVALDGGVAPAVAELVAKPRVDPDRRVPLIAPAAAHVVEPGADGRPVGLQEAVLGLAAPWRREREVLGPQVLADRGLRDPGRPCYGRDRLAVPAPPSHILYLAHADHFLFGPLHVDHGCKDMMGPR